MLIVVDIAADRAESTCAFCRHRAEFFRDLAEKSPSPDSRKWAQDMAALYAALAEGIRQGQAAGDNVLQTMRTMLQPYIDRYGIETVRDMILDSIKQGVTYGNNA